MATPGTLSGENKVTVTSLGTKFGPFTDEPDDKLIGVRDPRGFRPLCLGRLAEAWVVASEWLGDPLALMAPWVAVVLVQLTDWGGRLAVLGTLYRVDTGAWARAAGFPVITALRPAAEALPRKRSWIAR